MIDWSQNSLIGLKTHRDSRGSRDSKAHAFDTCLSNHTTSLEENCEATT